MQQVKVIGAQTYEKITTAGYIAQGEYFIRKSDALALVVGKVGYVGTEAAIELLDAVTMKPVAEHTRDELNSLDDTYLRVKQTCVFEIEFNDGFGSGTTCIQVSSYRNQKAQRRVQRYSPTLKTGRMTVLQPGLGPTGTSVVTTPLSVSSASTAASVVSLHVDDLEEVSLKETVNPPNLIASKTTTGAHLPVLDIDFPISVMESDTPGHYHLFMEKPMQEEEYFDFLDLMAVAGVVEEGYAKAARERGASFVRIRE